MLSSLICVQETAPMNCISFNVIWRYSKGVCFPPAIGNAYACLSNADKRKQYDQCGEEKRHPSRQGQTNGDFQADISPEDLFNMFFGGGFPASEWHTQSLETIASTYFTSSICVVVLTPPLLMLYLLVVCCASQGNVHVYRNGRYQRPAGQQGQQREVCLFFLWLHILQFRSLISRYI